MTACIAPKATHLLHRVDPQVRLGDYLAALRFWLDVPDPRIRSILLVENSDASLEPLQALAASHNPHGRDVEIGRFGDNVIPPGVGYGYPEFSMLDDASQRSRLWRSAETTHLIKATGRLTFPNVSRLLARMPPGTEFLADARDRGNPWRRRPNHGYLTAQLMIFTPAFYREHLFGIRHQMSDHYAWMLIENVMYRELLPLHDGRRVRLRFPVNCSPSGQAGAWKKSYDAPRQRMQNLARAAARIVAPFWWV